MNIGFSLLQPRNASSSIRVKIHFGAFKVINGKKNYYPFRATLPWNIPVNLWDQDKHTVKKHRSYQDSELVNRAIEKLKAEMRAYEIKCQLDAIAMTEEGIKNTYYSVVAPRSKAITPHFFIDAFVKYIEESENGQRLTANGKRISLGTIKRYKLSLWHFENFEEKFGDVSLDELNKSLGSKLHQYFNEANLAHNTKVNHIRTYISVYNYIVEKSWMEATDFHKIRIDEIESDTIALSMDEVNALFNLHLSGDTEAEVVRDTFIIGIWTLMRFGDYSSIKEFNIREKYIKYNTTKTDIPVVIPIHAQLAHVLEKYDGKLPDAPSEPVFNRVIKQIAKKAGITQLEEKREHKAGKVTKKIIPRYKMITSHTSRRTGATLLYLEGVPKKQIMMLTGHKQEKHFDRYIRIGAFANARLLSERDIFKLEKKQTTEVQDGYYWFSVTTEKFVGELLEGVIYRFRAQPISLQTFLKKNGRVLEEIRSA